MVEHLDWLDRLERLDWVKRMDWLEWLDFPAPLAAGYTTILKEVDIFVSCRYFFSFWKKISKMLSCYGWYEPEPSLECSSPDERGKSCLWSVRLVINWLVWNISSLQEIEEGVPKTEEIRTVFLPLHGYPRGRVFRVFLFHVFTFDNNSYLKFLLWTNILELHDQFPYETRDGRWLFSLDSFVRLQTVKYK